MPRRAVSQIDRRAFDDHAFVALWRVMPSWRLRRPSGPVSQEPSWRIGDFTARSTASNASAGRRTGRRHRTVDGGRTHLIPTAIHRTRHRTGPCSILMRLESMRRAAAAGLSRCSATTSDDLIGARARDREKSSPPSPTPIQTDARRLGALPLLIAAKLANGEPVPPRSQPTRDPDDAHPPATSNMRGLCAAWYIRRLLRATDRHAVTQHFHALRASRGVAPESSRI